MTKITQTAVRYMYTGPTHLDFQLHHLAHNPIKCIMFVVMFIIDYQSVTLKQELIHSLLEAI